MKKRIQAKIENLQQQPDHVRFRAASYFTAISGIVLVLLWLVVFLPFQLYVGSRGDDSDGVDSKSAQATITPEFREDGIPQVGGVSQDNRNADTKNVPLFVTPVPSETPTPTATPSSIE